MGGQLQFRFEGATCECYWVEIDLWEKVSGQMLWTERVALAAEIALKEWQRVQGLHDFMAVGRAHFPEQFQVCMASGRDPAEAMCFVWYLETEIGWASLKRNGATVITVER